MSGFSRHVSLQANARYAKGFTLVEIIVTIVVIGILGVGIASFIGRSTEGMIDASERSKIASIAWVVSEKMSRELRTALPNSVRVVSGGTCVEFIPTIAATDYLSAPIASAATTFEVVPFPNYETASVDTSLDRAVVYPNAQTTADLYDLSLSPRSVSPLLTSLTAGTTPGSELLTLSAGHQFVTDSPTKRLYIVQDPRMFCFSSGFLYRYSEYGFDASSGLQNQTVIADGISSGNFVFVGATLVRNGVINIAYSIIGDNGELQSVNQEVQIRNVP